MWLIMLNYWWVTRPKRKLNSIPDILGVFAEQALNQVWSGQRNSHLSFEDTLEKSGLKREGNRRDQTGGGARTYKAWLVSLGLIFSQSVTKQLQLTLAGEAIMNGSSPVNVLTNQVLKYQFPSSYSLGRGVNVNTRFCIHPFWFLLKLLMDKRITWLTQEEIAKIIITEAENETDNCYEYIVKRILDFRNSGNTCLASDFEKHYKPSKGNVNPAHPYSHLEDTANTIINWLEYTQLVIRSDGKLGILDDCQEKVALIIENHLPFIKRPEDHEFFQRRYGLDPLHQKDTRNLNKTQTITAYMIAEHRIKQSFISYSLKEPIGGITAALINKIAIQTGIKEEIVSEVLHENYPHGSIGAFMSNYFEMAFRGTKDCRKFEETTANIFRTVFDFQADWLGSAWSGKEVPDILLTSTKYNFQAIIDTKAYSRYDLPTTQRDRMIHHYLPDISLYGSNSMPTAFFSYIAGGFSSTIANPLNKIVTESGINGSALTVELFIKMAEKHSENPYTHAEIKNILSSNKKIELDDLDKPFEFMVAEKMV